MPQQRICGAVWRTAFIDAEFGILIRPAKRPALLTALRAKGYRDVYGNARQNLPPYMASWHCRRRRSSATARAAVTLSAPVRDQYADTVFGTRFYYTTPSYVMMNCSSITHSRTASST